MHQLIDIRKEDELKFDDQGVATLFSSADASVAFGRVPPGQMGMQGLSAPGAEDNAFVMSGMLSYPTEGSRDVFVAKGSWVVARPGEVHGYWNKSAKPVTLLMFRARTTAKAGPGQQRIYRPADSGMLKGVTPVRSVGYETLASRGENITLHPGEPTELVPALCSVLLVTEGRMMALFSRQKISLDYGEGLVFIREAVEVIGVGGLSQAVLFSTVR